jgi:cell division protein FtsB
MKRYLPMSKDELGYDMQATVVEDPDGPYVLFSDHESAVASCRKEWFDKGRNSVLRNNESGCCCLFNEQDEIVSVCMAHKELLAEKDKKIDALEQLRPVWAQGFSDESIAAQVSWAALSSIWKILGVNSQTEAVTALAEKDKRIAELEAELAKLKEERDTLKAENRSLEWQIYRPLKEGEITRDGDQVLGPEDDAVWEPVTGNYRPAPSPLYPAHCQYRRPIVDELKKDMESDYFYRKCVAGKESAREKKIKELEAELAKLRKFKIAASKDRCRECPFLDDAQKCHEGLTSERDRLEHELEEWKIRFHQIGGQKMLDRLNYLNEKCPQLEAELAKAREIIEGKHLSIRDMDGIWDGIKDKQDHKEVGE